MGLLLVASFLEPDLKTGVKNEFFRERKKIPSWKRLKIYSRGTAIDSAHLKKKEKNDKNQVTYHH